MTCVETLTMSPRNTEQQRPAVTKSLGGGLGLRSSKRSEAAATQISTNLKLSIAQELFDSKVAKAAASRRAAKQKDATPTAPKRKAAIQSPSSSSSTSTATTASSSTIASAASTPAPKSTGNPLKSMLSASLHRSRKLGVKDPADTPSTREPEFGPDYQCELKEETSNRSERSLPSAFGRKTSPRSCLRKSAGRDAPAKRAPPKRSVSAGQLSLQVRLPGQLKPITRTRSITFDESVRVRKVPSISELSEGRNDELWFQSEEYDTIKRKTYSLIRAIQQGQTGGVNYCTRGLEKYFDAEKVQQRRIAAWESVFYTQEGQRRKGSFDDLQVASAYKSLTSESLQEAAGRGKNDQETIERYVRRTRDIVRSRSMPMPGVARSVTM